MGAECAGSYSRTQKLSSSSILSEEALPGHAAYHGQLAVRARTHAVRPKLPSAYAAREPTRSSPDSERLTCRIL